jgi:hypothetical protein
LIARLKHPEDHYECTDPKKANAVLMSLCQEAADALAAPLQEPVAVTYKEVADTMNALWGGTLKQVQIAMELANKKLYTTPPAQPAPLQSCYCLNCEALSKELAAFKAQPAPVPDYAWPTVADYEKDVGFEVNEAFKMAWAMARTTNALFT